MKSRSHRLPDPHDDWGDGSWTVDCVCGVNFDDGEEMVNCDECGVWVHTRCSRYVKSEKRFACDKCKNRSSRNGSEETEVAQLLVELPNKTIAMDNAYGVAANSRKAFRLWTETPMEDRVHVQGVPGGDPSLFAGLSSIFSRQLWKSSGYVPKKFNFRYREFSCWDDDVDDGEEGEKVNEKEGEKVEEVKGLTKEDEDKAKEKHELYSVEEKIDKEDAKEAKEETQKDKEVEDRIPEDKEEDGKQKEKDKVKEKAKEDDGKTKEEEEEPEKRIHREKGNSVENGAGASFSLGKETISPFTTAAAAATSTIATFVGDSVGFESKVEEDGKFESLSPEQIKVATGEDLNVSGPDNGLKNDRGSVQPRSVYYGKRKKEELRMSKDWNSKKKAKIVEKEGDQQKKAAAALLTDSTIPSDEKQLGSNEDRGSSAVIPGTECRQGGNPSDSVPGDKPPDYYQVVNEDVNQRGIIASSEHVRETVVKHIAAGDGKSKEDNGGYQISMKSENSPKIDDGVTSRPEHADFQSAVKEETRLQKLETVIEDVATAAPEVEKNQNTRALSGSLIVKSSQPNAELKAETDDTSRGLKLQPSPPTAVKLDKTKLVAKYPKASNGNLNESREGGDSNATKLKSEASDYKAQDARNKVINDHRKDNVVKSSNDACQPKPALAGPEGSMEIRRSSSGHKSTSKPAEEPSKSGGRSSNHSAAKSQCKVVASTEKSSLSSANAMPKSISASADSRVTVNDKNHGNQDRRDRQRGTSDRNITDKKENPISDVVKDEDRYEKSKKVAKELPKSSHRSLSNTSQSSKFAHATSSKRSSPDLRDDVLHSSSKRSSSLTNVNAAAVSGETASSLQTECVSNMQNKIPGSVSSQKGEKMNQSSSQSSSRAHGSVMNPPVASSVPATLSDEELALLLHQELNSSPRVPRVPRMRHAGSLPQLTSSSGTSTLMKRTSSIGGKDHSLTSRRKAKDSTKDGSHSSRDIGDEVKKTDRGRASPDHRTQDSGCTADSIVKREAESNSSRGVSLKNSSPVQAANLTSGIFSSAESNERKLSYTRNSPGDALEDETGLNGHTTTHRTLPALLDEIMSKGERMTYEELCSAVLPHWPHLRKHNGERYAYSSHSQAVLDCLRNRNEWARLVDRGPKSSGSRKRRKTDADPTSIESEDNEDSRDRARKDVGRKRFDSRKEDFPKGKRKARKRRRLALQGRGVRDVRRRRRANVISDDEDVSGSESSEGSMFSEDGMEGDGKSADGSEASASSDETGTVL